MTERVGHIPMPNSRQGSSITHIVQELCRQHERHGGENFAAMAADRDARVDAATNVLVPFEDVCPKGYFDRRELMTDAVRGRLGLDRRLHTAIFKMALSALAEHPLDAIVIHEGHHASEALPIARKKLPSTRVALHVNTPPSQSYSRREMRRFLDAADVLVAASSHMRSTLSSRAGRDLDVSVVPNGVSATFFEAERREIAPNVLYAGQVAHHKGVHLMLEAVAAIAPRHPGLVIEIVGSAHHGDDVELSSYEEQLRVFAAEHFAGGTVRFTPYAPQPELAALFASATVVCVPSIWDEPFGMVAAEAMAAGAPVLAARAGGLVDFVPGTDLMDPSDIPSFAERIDAYLSDPALARESSERNRATAQEYAWPRVYDRWRNAILGQSG